MIVGVSRYRPWAAKYFDGSICLGDLWENIRGTGEGHLLDIDGIQGDRFSTLHPIRSVGKIQKMFGLVLRRERKFLQEVKDFVNRNDGTSLTFLQSIGFRSVTFLL